MEEELIEGIFDRLSQRPRKLLNTLFLLFAFLGVAFFILTLVFHSIRVLDPDKQLYDAVAGFSTVLFGIFSPFTLWYVRRRFFTRRTEAIPRAERKPDVRQAALANVRKLVDQRWDNLFLTGIEFLLDLRFEMSAIHRPRILPLSFMDGDFVPQHDSPLELFNNSGRSLLILGRPGTGKSFTLLRLAKELAAEAHTDPEKRIPVILNLASWSERRFRTLVEWIADELAKPASPYGLSRELAAAWIEAGNFIYLLDGLDEVIEPARASCLAAINDFLDGASGQLQKPEVALCSRIDEYKALGDKASLLLAVRIEPLSDEEVDRYLSQDALKLTAFRQLLEREAELRAKINTPLMLAVITLAYENAGPNTLEGLDVGEDFETHLYEQFTERMFVHRPLSEEVAFDKKQAVRWLSNLARGMNVNNPAVFYIEELQPNWLSKNNYRWYKALSGLVLGLIFGLILGLIYGLYEWSDVPLGSGGNAWLYMSGFTIIVLLINWMIFGLQSELLESNYWDLATGPIFWLIIGLIFAIIIGLISGLSSFLTSGIKGRWRRIFWYLISFSFAFGLIAGPIFWPLADPFLPLLSLRRSGASDVMIAGLIAGLVFSLIFGTVSCINVYDQRVNLMDNVKVRRPSLRQLVHAALSGLILGMIAGLISGLTLVPIFGLDLLRFSLGDLLIQVLVFGLIGLVFGFFFAFVAQVPVQTEWQRPNQGIHGSLKRGLLMLVVVFALLALFAIISRLAYVSIIASIASFVGAFVLPFSFLYYGGLAAIQHYWLRWMLARRNILPLKPVPFLGAMQERLFLEPQGGGWKFFHSTYQEYLASLDTR